MLKKIHRYKLQTDADDVFNECRIKKMFTTQKTLYKNSIKYLNRNKPEIFRRRKKNTYFCRRIALNIMMIQLRMIVNNFIKCNKVQKTWNYLSDL